MHDPMHTTESEVIYTMHMCIDIPNTNTRAYLARIPTHLPSFIPVNNAIVYIMHKHATTRSCAQAMYCTHVSVWSVELWASAAAMCCAPSAPMEFLLRLYAHVCVRRMIQRTCIAHDARSYTYNRERGHVHHAYVHADIPNTNTRAYLARIPTYLPTYLPSF
jgi:hypothetical protein